MNDKRFKVTLNEDELKAVINHHKYSTADYSVETSARIHDLTKRLNKGSEPDIEQGNEEEKQAATPKANPTPAPQPWG